MKKPAPLRLWILTTEYEPDIIGGLGTVATNLTKAYVNAGIHVTVLKAHRSNRFQISGKPGLRMIRLPINSSIPAINRFINKNGYRKPDGIHIHSIDFAGLAEYYRKTHRTPVIYTCHSLVAMEPRSKKSRKRSSRQELLLRISNRIVVPSRWEAGKLKAMYPFCAKKITVIRHGVNVRPMKRRIARNRLLFVGRLIRIKGLEPLLEAIASLKRKDKNVSLHIVGKGSKNYVKRLKSLSEKLDIRSNVRMLGYRSQKKMQTIYGSYGAVVMPSKTESFGLVALEALAGGVPLVATRSGGLSEFVNGTVAQTIPKVERKAIAEAIEKMWRNPSITDKRVSAGLKLASRFKWPQVARQYKKLFQETSKKT